MAASYHDLVIVAPTGERWWWIDFEWVFNKRGDHVRVEILQSRCRHCRALFTVTAKLPRSIIGRYLARSQCETR